MTEEKKDTHKNEPIWIDTTKCKSCGDCVFACPYGVLAMKKNPKSLDGETVFVLHPYYCIGACKMCVRACPEPFAIHLKEITEFVFPKKSDVALAREKDEEEARLCPSENSGLRHGEGGGE
jgi:2-oxoglutarate ferredoxin oxidoreductase subunit delta